MWQFPINQSVGFMTPEKHAWGTDFFLHLTQLPGISYYLNERFRFLQLKLDSLKGREVTNGSRAVRWFVECRDYVAVDASLPVVKTHELRNCDFWKFENMPSLFPFFSLSFEDEKFEAVIIFGVSVTRIFRLWASGSAWPARRCPV